MRDIFSFCVVEMVETPKPETGISDEELMRLTMALNDDDFNFEEDFPEVVDVNPSKVNRHNFVSY
jgi:hypothetical protein